MSTVGAWPSRASREVQTASYSILGVAVRVTSDVAAALERVEDSYAAFRCGHEPASGDDVLTVELRRIDEGTSFLVQDGDGYAFTWQREELAIIDLLGRLVAGVLPRLHARGMDPIHAGAVIRRGRALIVCGRSGQGKTTLVLGLLRRGMGLLSGEFAVLDSGSGRVVPYRRSLHVRPGTPELVPELAFLHGTPRHELGGGIEWAVSPAALERALPGCLGPAAPLGHVLLLDGEPSADRAPVLTPVAPALAAIELLHGTWTASVDFDGALRRVGTQIAGARCARLNAGGLEATVDQVLAWLEETGA